VPEYQEDDGPVCSLCERRVYKLAKSKPATCRQCVTEYWEVTVTNADSYPLQNHEATRREKTLLLSEKLADNHFDKLLKAVTLRNVSDCLWCFTYFL
jgi:hypothetical protein